MHAHTQITYAYTYGCGSIHVCVLIVCALIYSVPAMGKAKTKKVIEKKVDDDYDDELAIERSGYDSTDTDDSTSCVGRN